MKHLGLPLETAKAVLGEMLPEKLLDMNHKALQKGYDSAQDGEQLPVPKPAKRLLLTGAQAMAMGAIAGGMQFYSAYPMSPATSLLIFFTAYANEHHLAVEQRRMRSPRLTWPWALRMRGHAQW